MSYLTAVLERERLDKPNTDQSTIELSLVELRQLKLFRVTVSHGTPILHPVTVELWTHYDRQ